MLSGLHAQTSVCSQTRKWKWGHSISTKSVWLWSTWCQPNWGPPSPPTIFPCGRGCVTDATKIPAGRAARQIWIALMFMCPSTPLVNILGVYFFRFTCICDESFFCLLWYFVVLDHLCKVNWTREGFPWLGDGRKFRILATSDRFPRSRQSRLGPIQES